MRIGWMRGMRRVGWRRVRFRGGRVSPGLVFGLFWEGDGARVWLGMIVEKWSRVAMV